MNLEEQINADLRTAMLARDEASLRGLRAIKAAILLQKTGSAESISQADEIKMLQKLVKQRKESLDIYKSQEREDLAKKEMEEIAVIEKFLPSMMTGDELRSVIKQIIESTGAKSPAEMGKVMGAASKQLAGKADNKEISTIVKELLGG